MIVSYYNICPQMSTLLIFRHTNFFLFFLKELYIYRFIIYSLLYYRRNGGSFLQQQRFLLMITEILSWNGGDFFFCWRRFFLLFRTEKISVMK